MRKVAGIGIGVIIIVLMVIVVMQYYALQNLQELQFSPRSVGNFDKSTTSLDIEIDACNPTQFPTGFDEIRFELNNLHNNNYNVTIMREFATMTLNGHTFMPKETVTLQGRIHVNVPSQYWWKIYNIFTSLSHDDITLKVTLDTKVFGFVPLSVNRDFDYDEFVALLVSGRATQFACA